MAFAPFMDSVTVGVTAVQLSALLAAIDANLSTRLSYLEIQYDQTGSGQLYIGRSNVSATHCGKNLVPTITQNVHVFGGGMTDTKDVWLVSDTADQQVNIVAIPIGA